jgi:hypothetical protein
MADDKKFFVKNSGPGIWFVIHTLALYAKNDKAKEAFVVSINLLCDNFGCETCKPHFRKFIDTHDLKKYWHVNFDFEDDVGFFKWTWELHNEVNKKLNKPIVAFEDALYDFKNNICKNCDTPKANPILVAVPVKEEITFKLVSR